MNLNSIFSDETEYFRTPAEPDYGDVVSIRIRIEKNAAERVMLMMGGRKLAVLMSKVSSDEFFDWFESEIVCLENELSYYFEIEAEERLYIYNKLGAAEIKKGAAPEEIYSFRFTPGFHVPEWAKGAVEYQIFTDRFCNGNPVNDVCNNEYYYEIGHSRHIDDWNTPPDSTDIRCFYGGDLQGIMQKLDYLQELGVEVIYLNPIFISPSSHKYDTQDYDHIDPHLAIIADDVDHAMQSWEKHNGYAPKYIRRVTSRENLEKSDAYFAEFCAEIHRRGMKIILDGVFNHCGSFNKWFDREGIYLGKHGYEKGACQDNNSPYRNYFRFTGRGNRFADYEGWWGHITLPKLNYEGSLELRERMFAIAEKWALPPYSIDGWRLDVAADLGHSLEFNHNFWREFRTRLKTINPDILILAEHYGNPVEWLRGDQWDTIMNYDAFMEPVTAFLTGMEKHSDSRRDELYQDGDAFFETMLKKMACFECPSLYSAMNELSNHDHSRFLTRTNRTVGRISTLGSAAAGKGINKAVFREAVVIQMTWPGAPTIYYADEAGQIGWTDPDNRRTYPWGNEDRELIAFHKALTAMRKDFPVLAKGSVKPLYSASGIIVYARFNGESTAIIACSNNSAEKHISFDVSSLGIRDGICPEQLFQSSEEGFTSEKKPAGEVKNSLLKLDLPPLSATVYSI